MITAQVFKVLCKLIKELEEKFDSKLEGFGKKFIGLLQGFTVLDPERQTMTSREVCEQYGISMRTLCDMRKKGIIPFTKHGDAPNSKITYRIADVAEVFAGRDNY